MKIRYTTRKLISLPFKTLVRTKEEFKFFLELGTKFFGKRNSFPPEFLDSIEFPIWLYIGYRWDNGSISKQINYDYGDKEHRPDFQTISIDELKKFYEDKV